MGIYIRGKGIEMPPPGQFIDLVIDGDGKVYYYDDDDDGDAIGEAIEIQDNSMIIVRKRSEDECPYGGKE